LVGGTVPKTRRFGPAAQGVLYDNMQLITPGNSAVILLFAVASSGPQWRPFPGCPAGMVTTTSALPPSPLPGLTLGGEWFLDASLGLINLSGAATQSSAGNYENRITIPLSLPPWVTGQIHLLIQPISLDGNLLYAGDAQSITIGS
jgi:hypothetical protein